VTAGLRIGSVPYLNAEPLLDGLQAELRVEPSRLAKALLAGEVDVAVLPVGAALRHDLRVLPSCGVASDGAVQSVFLLHEEPFGEIRTIHPDPASVSSNLLARILVERFGSGTWEERGREAPAQARVLIGDPALALKSWNGTDLGEAWKRFTGHPFVFAAWVIGPHVPDRDWKATDRALLEAAARGMEASPSLAAAQTVVSPGRALEYLRNLRFRLDDRYHSGMELYARHAASLGVGSGKVRWAC
jgi:chorismate dehydratase